MPPGRTRAPDYPLGDPTVRVCHAFRTVRCASCDHSDDWRDRIDASFRERPGNRQSEQLFAYLDAVKDTPHTSGTGRVYRTGPLRPRGVRGPGPNMKWGREHPAPRSGNSLGSLNIASARSCDRSPTAGDLLEAETPPASLIPPLRAARAGHYHTSTLASGTLPVPQHTAISAGRRRESPGREGGDSTWRPHATSSFFVYPGGVQPKLRSRVWPETPRSLTLAFPHLLAPHPSSAPEPPLVLWSSSLSSWPSWDDRLGARPDAWRRGDRCLARPRRSGVY